MELQATKLRLGAHRARVILVLLPLLLAFGCSNTANDANRHQLEQNQALIEQQQRDLAKLQVEQQQNLPPAPTPGSTGNCDKGVEATATKRGGDAYASGDMSRALALAIRRTSESMFRT